MAGMTQRQKPEARLIRGSLLKFADWKWSIGKEKEAVEVKEGRRLIAVATAAAWVKWQGGKPVEYRLREPGVPHAGARRARRQRSGRVGGRPGWRAARSLAEHALRAPDRSADRRGFYLLDLELGRSRLRDQSCRSDQAHAGQAPDAVPLVELGAAPMSTKYGRKSKPMLKVVGWRNHGARAS